MENCDNIYNQDFIEDGNGNRIHKTANVNSNVTLGKNNTIGANCTIGSNGEIRNTKFEDFHGTVVIGDNNDIHELVTIQTPKDEGAVTRIGNRNLITAHSHIGHDAIIEDDCEICISVIGGYAHICEGARIKMNSTIRNRVMVCKAATVGMGSVVVKNVPYGATVYGNPAKEHPCNWLKELKAERDKLHEWINSTDPEIQHDFVSQAGNMQSWYRAKLDTLNWILGLIEPAKEHTKE